MKIAFTFCCLILSALALADDQKVELTIINTSKTVAFEVQFKGQDTDINPEILKTGIPAADEKGPKTVIATLTRPAGFSPPVGTLLLNPRIERIGITIADNELTVTGNSCAFCIPKAWAKPTPIKDGKTTVIIKLRE